MKTSIITVVQKAGQLVLQWHLHVSSWVARLIGPMVFNYGTNQKGWNISTSQLLGFPEHSVGRELGEFLKKNKLEPLAGAEYHDVQHVLLGYSISFTDEVALQFFLHGNGKCSIASVSTMIGAWCILPHQWSYLKAAYRRGRACRDVSGVDLHAILAENLEQARHQMLSADYVTVRPTL